MFNFLASEFLVAYITIVASDWPRTFFKPKVFCLAYIYTYVAIKPGLIHCTQGTDLHTYVR